MKTFASVVCVACCVWSSVVFGQETMKEGAMSKTAAAAKKKLMAPETKDAAKKAMMGKDSKVPGMVSKEMIHEEMKSDKETMGKVEKTTMTQSPDDKMMMSEEKVSMAGKKMMDEPDAMHGLFQELVARHIAAKKIATMKKTDPKMVTKGGKEMKAMLMDDGAMMKTKKEMMTSEETAMMMAREELIHSLMLDKEVMALVEKEAAMHEDPKMAPMMADDKMKMEGEAMMKDKGKAKGMMQETMVRKMVDDKMTEGKMVEGKPKMKKDEKKPKQ